MAEQDRPGGFESGAAAIAGLSAAGFALLFRSRTLLPPGFFDALAVTALGFGLSFMAHRFLSAAAATLARGAGLALGALLVAGSLIPPFERAALPLVGWILGASLLQAATRARRNAVVLAALGVSLVALGSVVAWIGASAWPEAQRLRWTISAASLAGALALVARIWVVRHSPRLAPSPAGVLAALALAATYVAYRPLVASKIANLPLYEWTLGVAVAVLLLGRLRRGARDSAVAEAWTGQARRHTQDATPVYDSRMPPLAAAIQRYLETGEGFGEYQAAMLRAAPHAPPPFRKALQGMSAVQARGRAAKAARTSRLTAHQELLERLNGDPAPAVLAHP